MSAAGVATLVEQFTRRHMVKLAAEFAFPNVPSMVSTWGYQRTYHMASSLVNARGFATNHVFKG